MSTFGDGVYQWGGVPVGGYSPMDMYAGSKNKVYFVDGDNGSDGNDGLSPTSATKTIQQAIDLVSGAGAVIYIFPKAITALATDPTSYAETLIIGNDTPQLSLIGVPTGRTQGGLPQLKKGSGTTHALDIRAPGCRIANLGFNGAGMTADGGASGIYLNDDGGTTYVAFGTTIENCHFKSLGRGHANAAAAIAWGTNGGAWQTIIRNNIFYNCLGGISVLGTGGSVPQDVVIENNVFTSSVGTNVDADIYVGGSGVKGLAIRRNTFATIDVPDHASGAVDRYISLASGSEGVLDGNVFSCIVGEAETEVTFGAAGTAAVIPTTVRMGNNYGETSTTGDSNDFGFVFRT